MVRSMRTFILGAGLLAAGWAQSKPSKVPTEYALRRAQQSQPRSFAANLALGQLLLESGQAAQAIPFLTTAASLQPHDVPARHDLAVAFIEASRLVEAQRILAELEVEAPSPGIVHLEALWLAASGKAGPAAEKFQLAAEAEPTEKHLFDWANHLLNHSASEPALQIFRYAGERFPRSARLKVAEGIALYALGEFDLAVQSVCAGVDLDPKDLRPLVFLGLLIDVSPENGAALRQRLQHFAALYPSYAQAQYLYGLSLLETSATAAELHLRRAVALDPRMAEPHLELGKLYADANRTTEAIRELQAALRLAPQLDTAHYRLGQLYQRTGQSTLANKHLAAYRKLRSEKAAHEAERRAKQP